MFPPPHRWITTLTVVLALGTAILPPGWILCVAPDGHLVFEIAPLAGTACCNLPPSAGRIAEACEPESCVSCEDVFLGNGAALSRADADLPAPVIVAVVLRFASRPMPAAMRVSERITTAGTSNTPSATVLRC